MSGGHGKAKGGGVRKLVILILLVAGVIVLHRFAVRTVGFDPSAMLALGFVVLASYTFGQLVERVGLPHITGYLVAGMLFGPSVAAALPATLRVPPFDDGLLSESVMSQLAPLNTLAVGLIALTAGGELKVDILRKGLGAIVGIIGGQMLFVMTLVSAFLVGVSGVVPEVRFPGLGELDLGGVLALGAVLGSVSVATSPSVTIAVINDLRARGPVTSTVLATVVFKDVIDVIMFAVITTLAAQTLGFGATSEGSLGLYLLQHIGGALVAGVLLGFGMVLYLRFVKAELLLFTVGVVFVAAFVAQQLHLEALVVFLAAGFVAANFSSEGDHLLETVETLSLPVYVVFFTLAGAHLNMQFLWEIKFFALALVVLRATGMYLGVAVGGRLGGASKELRKHGWFGFISQAGVSLSLASIVARNFEGPGQAISSLIVAGVAVNEMLGPVLLKLGLGGAGEIGAARREEAEPEPEAAPSTETAARAEKDELAPWPAPEKGADAWGAPLSSSAPELDGAVRDLTFDLAQLAREVADEPLARFREDALSYVRDLRREFLRHHRRITVHATSESAELDAAEALRLEQAELAEKWRAAVLARAARVKQLPTWDPRPILDAAEAITDTLPAIVAGAYEEGCFAPREDDSSLVALGRWWLRVRRGARRVFGEGMPPRDVHLRALARYHFWGELPERLEPVAALYAQAESHLVARTRSIFDGLVVQYDALAGEVEAAQRAEAERAGKPKNGEDVAVGGEADPSDAMSAERLAERLREVRERVDEELMLAVQEVDRIADDVALRTSTALGVCLRALKEDALKAGTPDLPMRKRAASALYRRRDEALRWLERGTAGARDTAAALYNRLALEMELIALEGRVKDALEEHATALGRDVRGRAHRQVERVHAAIAEAQQELTELLGGEHTPAELSRAVRESCEPVVRVSAEAARVAALLRDQLTDERSVTAVLDALTRAAQGLTDRYRIPAGPVSRGEHRLPPPVGTVEVPFREWVLARIETGLAPRLLTSTREVAAKVEPLAQALSELERRVAFNVELGTSELSILEDDSVPAQTKKLLREMLVGALDRNRELFHGYAQASEKWGEEVRSAIRDAVLSGLEDLRTGIVDGEVGRLRSQMVRDVRSRRVLRFFKELRGALVRSASIGLRVAREAIGETRLDRLRARLGLPVRLAEEDIGERTFEVPEPASSIPMVYRRLFSAQALEAGDILTGRDEELRRAMNVLEGRTRALLRTVAVVGPDGVGKSAFVNAVVRARRWPKVHELTLKEPATVEQVEALFEQESEGHLFVLSGMHWLRSMTPGGFEPLRRFVAKVVADGGRNAFVVRADGLAWAQSCQVAPLADAFPEVVRLDPLEPEGLMRAVLARHTVSGYGLVFTQGVTAESRLEELVLQLSAPLSRPQEGFFRALHAASGGLLRDALRLWLASVEQVDEAGDFVHLGPVPTPSIYALRRLDDEQLLVLYQVARQGWMDATVLASLFRTDVTTAEARLGALAHVGILERKGAVWRIAVHLRGSTYRLLRERRYLA